MIDKDSRTIEFDDDSIIETPADNADANTSENASLSDMLDQYTSDGSETLTTSTDVTEEPVQQAPPSGTYTQSVNDDGSVSYGFMPASNYEVADAYITDEADAEVEEIEEADEAETADETEFSLAEPVVIPRYSNSFNRDNSARIEKEMKAKYVTKKFFAVALVLAVIVSSSIGAAVGGLVLSKGNSGGGSIGAGSAQNLEKATGSDMTIAQIVDANEDSVVEITTKIQVMSMFGSTESEAAGSGVIVREDGYIATNFHVIEGSNSVSVRLHDGSEYPAQVVGYDQQNDIAILKIDGKDFDAAEFGTSSNLAVGDLAVAIGNPLGQLGGTATSGIISSLDRQLEIDNRTLTLLQTDSAINPGNSGGGLFDANGKLIGIVVAKSSGTGIEGLGFAIPIDTAKPIIDDIIENGKITTKPAAGIVIAEISEDQLAMYGVDAAGVYISEVNGENAKQGGLEPGDRIVKFDGEDVKSSSALIRAIQKHKVGDNVEFVVERDGMQLSVRFDLEDSSKFN